jgi:hypothetical protein
MQETISIPGAYSSEVNQTFNSPVQLPDGCAIIGPTQKGEAYVPTSIQSPAQFSAVFGTDTSTSYVPQTVYNYLQAGDSINVTRVLGNGGWSFTSSRPLAAFVSGGVILTVLHPTLNTSAPSTLGLSGVSLDFPEDQNFAQWNSFNLICSGSHFTEINRGGDLLPWYPDYITKLWGTNAGFEKNSIFPYLNFPVKQTALLTGHEEEEATLVLSSTNCTFGSSTNAAGYDAASTPWVYGSAQTYLFKFVHRSQGFAGNTDVKIAIQNIQKTFSDDTTYATFDVLVRKFGDTDKTPVILEQYTQVTLNPDATNYIALVIGDKHREYDSNTGKVVEYGDYDNVSPYIRVVVSEPVANGALHPNVAPIGHEALLETIAGFTGKHLPAPTYVGSNTGSYVFSGFDYTNVDNLNYLNPVPQEATTGIGTAFTLGGSDNKFIVPFQGGNDGTSYSVIKKIGADIANDGTNVFGFDLSSNTASGFPAFKQAIDILSNKQLYKYGILAIPGIIEQYHGAVTEYAQSMVESRGDAVYLRDLVGVNETVATAITTAAGLNSSYSATYHPWVKVNDIGSSRKIYVPPTVYVPQVIAYSDKVSAPWYAPAGTGRGTIGGAIDTKNRLTNAEGGALYNAGINPIMKAPNTGVVIMGQKTLQKADNDLNRLNVRRLLITLKDYIGNIANDLVFEQNVNATRNAFLAKINPYLQSVQSGKGIVAFKTTCDATNNSSTDTARHILNCKIPIIPAESIEFVLLEFDLTPQGATFS